MKDYAFNELVAAGPFPIGEIDLPEFSYLLTPIVPHPKQNIFPANSL